MKWLVVCALVAVASVAVTGVAEDALAAPQTAKDALDVQLLRYESNNDGLGTYSFAYEQSDGSSRSEEGLLINAGAEDEHIAVKGSFSWLGPDGVAYTVDYIADENGYQPTMIQGPVGTPTAVVASLLGAEDEHIAVKGSFSWLGPDGVAYTVDYIADENGYQPTMIQGPVGTPTAVVASLLGAEDEHIAVKGSFSWLGPDGVAYTVDYIADENGYQLTMIQGPVGTPPAVVASLLGL